ncbi:MAG: hypothetical protein ABI459_04900 [Deltaproteobacteria bacterium]
MIRAITLITGLLASAAFAETTPEMLRDRVLAGDIDGVEALLSGSRTESPDHQRDLFRVLSSSDPDVVAFVRTWVATRPTSAYAQTAMARALLEASNDLRGTRPQAYTWGDAMTRSNVLDTIAAEHAKLAYAIDPSLVPASDPVLVLIKVVGGTQTEAEIVAKVMAVAPNAHTLELALIKAWPQWGGSFDAMWGLCAQYAPLVKDRPDYSPEVCMAQAILDSGHVDDAMDWLISIATPNNTKIPIAIRARVAVESIMRGDKSAQKLIDDYLADPAVTDIDTAWKYDSVYANIKKLPQVEPVVFARKMALAREALATDPYDPKNLRTLAGIAGHYVQLSEPPSPEDARAYLTKSLAMAPYDADTWEALGNTFGQADIEADQAESEAYRINAVVYSNHRADYVGHLLGWQVMHLETLKVGLGLKWGDPIPADALVPVLETAMCHAVRTGAIYDDMCPDGRFCQNGRDIGSEVAMRAAEAKSLGICKSELSAWFTSSLYYDEVPLTHDQSPFER